MLTPDGASVHVHATTHRGIETDAELPLPSPSYPALDELSRRYRGAPPPRSGGPGTSGESDVYRAAGFRGPTSITVARPVVTRTTEEVIAAHLSLSSVDPAPVRRPAGRVPRRGPRPAGRGEPDGGVQRAAARGRRRHLEEVARITLRPVTDAAAPSDLQRLAGLLSATGPAMELRSPLTGTRVGELPTSTESDVQAAAERARAAQVGWAARPVEERADLLLAFHDAVLDRRDELRRPGPVRRRQGPAQRHRGGAARRADRALLRPDGRALPAAPSVARACSRCSPGSTGTTSPRAWSA